MILQLNPLLPVITPLGPGFAFALIDYSQDHDTLYKVIITSTREIWDFKQSQIQACINITYGRVD